ncbi:Hypothetical predicted protein [Cloeon dipterum]|uniref:Uncharacterized protein n=1 Tax=Cloeon dipterum TaxID=197152 RepID=A0A8S1DZ18_9INSE|nr:Hypothetical predicted protein [Cloeon dipterum]
MCIAEEVHTRNASSRGLSFQPASPAPTKFIVSVKGEERVGGSLSFTIRPCRPNTESITKLQKEFRTHQI